MGITKANQPHSNEQWPNGWWVTRVAETGSTNTDLVKLGAEGAKHHSVLMADFQSAGKGRLDRTWVAEPGANLLVSLLFRTNETLERPLHQFTQMVGMSAARACMQLTGVLPDMKWPNDLLIGSKKFAGMIAQATNKGVVLGIGINVGMSKEELPVENATSLSLEGFSELDRNTILAAIINHFEINLEMWENDKSFLAEYRAASSSIGNEVEVTLPGGEVVKSTAQNISDTGALLLANGREVTVGDVVHLR